ncbi:MAG: class I SAM-dependent methyltransferase [Pseudomonadota bacterium]
MSELKTLISYAEKDYELIDSGEGYKLERFGKYVLSRTDPQALWKKLLPCSVWDKAHGKFIQEAKKASWELNSDLPACWEIKISGLCFKIKPTSFKHVGIFPEQSSNWDFIYNKIKEAKRQISVLNLFGYTGAATLAALKAGAEVCHVDASKVAITWANENADLNGLNRNKTRWMLDDALKFIKRELKRGRIYDAVIMDPPAFGHGAGGEIWKIEKNFTELLEIAKSLLSKDPLFFLINGYASGYSSIAYQNNLLDLAEKLGGKITHGECAIAEAKSDRLLPCGIYARWEK